jgi:hypothetical protein
MSRFIPIHEDEVLSVDVRLDEKSEEVDATLLVKPFTGKNYNHLCNIEQGARENKNIKLAEVWTSVFDFFVLGYIDENGKEVLFSDKNKKPSGYFNILFLQWFYNNINKINSLGVIQKKN